MPIFSNAKRSILFIHIPRAGGMSIEDLFLQNYWIPDLLHYHSKGIILGPYYNCTPQHVHAEILKQIPASALIKENILVETTSFTVVRNPIERFKSEINFQLASEKFPNTPYDTIANILIDAYEKNNYVFDNHLRPQHEFILENTKIFKFEDTIHNIRNILNETFDLELIEKEVFQNELSSKSGVRTSDIVLSSETLNKIQDLYKKDFEIFGYKIKEYEI
jgi:hypothetical protein